MIEKVSINIDKQMYTVEGVGMPVQTFRYTEIGEWNTVKNTEGEYIFDIQIDYDDYDGWTIQFVDLVDGENGCLKQGEKFNSIKPKIIKS